MDTYYFLLCFFIYGFLGWCTEVGFAAFKEHRFVNRGFLNGPICPIYGVGVTAVIAFLTPLEGNILLLYLSSVFLVTFLEGATGWAMDKIFHNKWWDYSDQPFNIGGYVCLIFSLIWGVCCVAIMKFIHPLIHKGIALLPHTLGILLIAILGIALLADLYVTASAIFKFNRRLATMEKIAGELHEISDQIGSDIYEKVILAMEKQETSRQKLDQAASGFLDKTQEVSEEIHIKIADLKARYQELGSKPSKVTLRLVKAFPKMESRKYKLQLEEFRKKLEEKIKR
ncbi:putative ABC transporter permease [Luxibacter massiliensis]|uniref:putative ABC transporter permease n=1 Tax=Luxibacter massiliensis TaxID=2219695 RepID=UPI000F06A96D|nr:hypothetical protein [Luxibacter massiliensis]